ncbi:MAG: hypothetical protein HC865_05195 [Cyanobacteria bacterium RU_5_0]|nr:hypothetical protein [Cyanobacteria bacterium RU_5_0]
MRPLRSSALAQAPIVDLGDNLTLYYAVWRSLTEAMGGGAPVTRDATSQCVGWFYRYTDAEGYARTAVSFRRARYPSHGNCINSDLPHKFSKIFVEWASCPSVDADS